VSDVTVVDALPLHYLNLRRTPFIDRGTER
jgi:hypothetical protein